MALFWASCIVISLLAMNIFEVYSGVLVLVYSCMCVDFEYTDWEGHLLQSSVYYISTTLHVPANIVAFISHASTSIVATIHLHITCFHQHSCYQHSCLYITCIFPPGCYSYHNVSTRPAVHLHNYYILHVHLIQFHYQLTF